MPQEEIDGRISGHYGWLGLMDSIEQEVRRNGIDPQHVTVDQLAPVDNFHMFRLAGTLALARVAAITRDDRVLDVGGGPGGPARQLAQRFGCEVTVLDLTPEYCAIGETLTTWTHLTQRVSFICGNALDIPFPDESFDVVWTQHASMNIPDKARLYGEMGRVVRHGGRLALFDILAGPNQPIHFPVPWASDQSYSFLQSPEDMRALITQTGFREVSWMTALELQAEVDRADGSRGGQQAAGGLNPGLLYGSDGPRYMANVQRNSEEGRILPAMGVFERV